MEPLAREVAHEAPRPRVGEHPAGLTFEDLGPAEFAARGQVEEFVVRDAAPEEEREAGGELEVGDPVGRLRRDARRVGLDPEEELRAHQHRPPGPSRSPRRSPPPSSPRGRGPSASSGPPHRPAGGRPGGPGRRGCGGRRRPHRPARPARGRRSGDGWACRRAPRGIGPGDRDLEERRREPGMPVHVVVGLERLALGLRERGGLLDEGHAERVGAGRRPDAGLQMLDRRSDARPPTSAASRGSSPSARGRARPRSRAAHGGPRHARCGPSSIGSGPRTRRPGGRCRG